MIEPTEPIYSLLVLRDYSNFWISHFRKIRKVILRKFAQRAFCQSAQGKNAKLADDLAAKAKASQSLWDMMVPDKNIGITHPMFAVLAIFTIGLHFYNKSNDEKLEEKLRQARLNKSLPIN